MRLVARERGERDERGAVAPFAALMLTVLLLAAAFVIDLGMQRVGRADVQALADVVALDLARDLDGTRTAAQQRTDLQSRADQSKNRNDDVIGDGVTVTPSLGKLDATGAFVTVANGEVPTAVRVVAHTDVGFAFGGVTDVDSGDTDRSAVGVASAGACFAVGSYLANLDTSQSTLLNPILGGLLGSTVNLQVAGYNGLAASSVTLTDLVTVGGLGVGSVDALLKLQSLRLDSFYLAMARVLDSQGRAAQAQVLRALSVSAGTPTIRLADLLTASATDQAALGASFNVLDLVTGAAMLANRNHAVAIPNLGFTVPGVATTGPATLTVVEAPQIACGGVGTTAHTAQVRLSLPLSINAQTVAIAGVGSVTLKKTDLALTMELGQAVAELTGLTCTNGSATSMSVSVGSSVVGSLSLSGSMGAAIDVSTFNSSNQNQGLLTLIQSVLGLLSTVNVKVDTSLNVGASTPVSTWRRNITVPLPGGYTTATGGGSNVVLSGLTASAKAETDVVVTARLLGLLGLTVKHYGSADGTGIFNAVVNPVLSHVTGAVLSPILNSLQTNLVAPLAKLLGVSIGGADVWAIPTPTCTNPRLRA